MYWNSVTTRKPTAKFNEISKTRWHPAHDEIDGGNCGNHGDGPVASCVLRVAWPGYKGFKWQGVGLGSPATGFSKPGAECCMGSRLTTSRNPHNINPL